MRAQLTDLVTTYLANTGLHAVLALSAESGTRTRIATAGAPRPPRAGITVASVWWVADELLAQRLAAMCYELADAAGTPRVRSWLTCPTRDADSLIAAAAIRLTTRVWADKTMRQRAQIAVDAIKAELERQRRTGDIKSVNRDYAEQRRIAEERGVKLAHSYGDYLAGITEKLVAEHARRNGEGLVSPGRECL